MIVRNICEIILYQCWRDVQNSCRNLMKRSHAQTVLKSLLGQLVDFSFLQRGLFRFILTFLLIKRENFQSSNCSAVEMDGFFTAGLLLNCEWCDRRIEPSCSDSVQVFPRLKMSTETLGVVT